MSANSKDKFPARIRQFGVWSMLLASGATTCDQRALAGQVIANAVVQPQVVTLDQQDQPNEMDVFTPAGETPVSTLPEIFRYGQLQLRPHADYTFLYGTGLQNVPGDQQESIVQELSTGILMNLGRHWTVDYTPTFQFYSNSKFKDSVNHAATLTGGVAYEDWVFSLTHNSEFTSSPLVETGSQTDQSLHTTSLGASHPINSRLSVDFGLSQNITLVSGLQDSYDWSTMEWLNYIFGPRLNIGIGAGGGYVLVDESSQGNAQFGGQSGNGNQYYEQLQGRLNWRATQKISFQINAGFEDRQFETGGVGDSFNPIFGASIQYQPFKATQISLSASRTVGSSSYYQASQESVTTTVNLTLDQKLFRNYDLSGSVGYSEDEYNTPAGGAPNNSANRNDSGVSFTARLSHPFFKRARWSVFYQYSDNTSSQAGYGFQSNQSGFELSYSY
jgi:hypothetical protein